MDYVGRAARWIVGPVADRLRPRWIFLRLLGVWFFSAFYSLWFQAPGLIGPNGILPAGPFLDSIARDHPGVARVITSPTLLWWLGTTDRGVLILCGIGLVASLLLIFNLAPRVATIICTIAFLSFTETLQRFASYQSDSMLLEAGLISIFFAPTGLRPKLGATTPPSRISLFALIWLGFRIYFESGVAKWRGQDPQWIGLTAMDKYYENGPLPTWVGWYAQQMLPHSFHAATAFMTLAVELVVVWAMFLPRPFRIALCLLITPFQIGIIATANYCFLNWLVLSLGLLLLDDTFLANFGLRTTTDAAIGKRPILPWIEGSTLSLQLYATTAILLLPYVTWLPRAPMELLAQYRLASGYGLFGHMTRQTYQIEFEGTLDGVEWKAYRFRYKPQGPKAPPGIYAPYQPRFEWNLWFAQLGDWRQNTWVVECAAKLLDGSPEVLALFKGDPFEGKRPLQIRTTKRLYWFSTPEEKEMTGAWWDRGDREPYGPTLQRSPNGQIVAIQGD